LRRENVKRPKTLLSTVLVAAFALVALAGCSGNAKTFSPSDGILDTGFWKSVTALDYVKLCEYEGIPIPNDVYQVSDESMQAEVDTILAEYASKEQIKDHVVVDGDTVNIDYVGSVGGVKFDGGSTEGQGTDVTIGVTSYVDDFLEQIIGHTPGESFDVKVTFPEDYGKEDLNGKDAVFAVTLNHIVKTTMPELSDGFVAENLSPTHGWNTVAEMRTGIKSELQDAAVADYVRNYLVENTTVSSVPEKLLEYQRKSLIHYYQGYADSYGISLEEFLVSYVGAATTDELFVMTAEDTRATATFQLVMQAIAEHAGISVSDDNVTAYFAERTGTEDYSEYKDSYGMPYFKGASITGVEDW
jgi:trigger factor